MGLHTSDLACAEEVWFYCKIPPSFGVRSSRPGDREYLYRKVKKRLVYVYSANQALGSVRRFTATKDQDEAYPT